MVKFNDGRIVRREDGTINRSDDAILVLKNEAAIDAMVNFLDDIRRYMKSTNDVTRRFFSKTITGVESKRAIDPASKELISLLNKLKTSDKLDKGEYRAIHKDIRYLNTQFSHLAQRVKKMDPGREQILPYAKSKYKEFIALQGGQLLERNFKFDEKRLASLTETTASTPTIIPIFENIMESIGHSINSLNEGVDQYMKVLTQISDRIGYKLPQNTIGNYQDAVNSRQSANTLMGGVQYNINWNKLTGLASPIEYEDISNYLEEIKKKIEDSLNEITKEVSSIFNQLNRATAGTGPLNAPFNFGKDVVGRSNALGEAFESFGKLSASLKDLKGMTKTVAGISKIVTLVLGAVLAIVARMFKASPILQAIADLFDLAMNLFFLPLGNALGTLLLPLFESLIEWVINWNRLFTDPSLSTFLDLIKSAIDFFFTKIDIFWKVATFSTEISQALGNLVLDAIKSACEFFGIDTQWVDDIQKIYNEVWNTIQGWPDELKGWFDGIFKGVKSFFENPGKAITDAVKAALSGVADDTPVIGNVKQAVDKASEGDYGGAYIDLLQSGIPFGPGGVIISGVTQGISNLFHADGGIFSRPTLGIIGEAGPEAVIPLDSAGMFGNTYYITISGDVYGVSDLESKIERAIQRTANKSYYR